MDSHQNAGLILANSEVRVHDLSILLPSLIDAIYSLLRRIAATVMASNALPASMLFTGLIVFFCKQETNRTCFLLSPPIAKVNYSNQSH